MLSHINRQQAIHIIHKCDYNNELRIQKLCPRLRLSGCSTQLHALICYNGGDFSKYSFQNRSKTHVPSKAQTQSPNSKSQVKICKVNYIQVLKLLTVSPYQPSHNFEVFGQQMCCFDICYCTIQVLTRTG
jgi:hypothetical protein